MKEVVADTEETRRVLREYGFPSLVRLVRTPEPVRVEAPSAKRGPKYVAVRNEVGLRQLQDAISNCNVCAIDTEASDKDPRRATLFGVAFAVEEGRAFYVPVTASDLQGLAPQDVLGVLRKLLGSELKAVGHNLKYDYVLLRRHGIDIKNTFFDTMLAAYDCYGDLNFFNLGALSRRFLGKDIKRYRDIVDDGKTLLDVPFNNLVEHGCSDADTTLRLYGYLKKALAERAIGDAFRTDTMTMMRLLGDTEVDGLRIDLHTVTRQQAALEREAIAIRKAIDAQDGKAVDLESMPGIGKFVMSLGGMREQIGRRSVTLAQLEQLGQSHDVIRNVVRYVRLRKRVKQLDAICEAATNGRVFPLFSQVRLRHGGISSIEPRLFDHDGEFASDFIGDAAIRRQLPHRKQALERLQTLTGDDALKADRKTGGAAFVPGIECGIPVDHSDLLLLVAIDLSSAALCRRLLLEPRTIVSLRATLRSRYGALFGWLDRYRRQAHADGFASWEGKRKYLEGLRSADLDRRSKAARSVVRWLLGV
jgi:DNA polymerase-1